MSAIVAVLALSHAAQADVTGPATVIDGDTIVVAGERIRLQGIDAPEMHQTCTAYGQEWACGRTSAKWLRAGKSGASATPATGTDDWYGRLLAVCCVRGEDLNKRIVREKRQEICRASDPVMGGGV